MAVRLKKILCIHGVAKYNHIILLSVSSLDFIIITVAPHRKKRQINFQLTTCDFSLCVQNREKREDIIHKRLLSGVAQTK